MLDRLKKRREFLRVARGGRKAVAPGLVLQVRRAAEAGSTGVRVGFTVSRKVGGAVARNRARRRLRAVAEQVLAERALPGRDYVLIGRAATVARPYEALVRDMETVLRRIGEAGGRRGRETDGTARRNGAR